MTIITTVDWRENTALWMRVHSRQLEYAYLQYFYSAHHDISSQHCITVAFQVKFLLSTFFEVRNLHTTCYHPIHKTEENKSNPFIISFYF